MRLASRIPRASREVVIWRRRKHREPRHPSFAVGRGHQRAKAFPKYGIDLPPARRRIPPVSTARQIEIARPSRRVDQRRSVRIEFRRCFADSLSESGAREPVQSFERNPFSDQRCWRRVNYCEIEKILADIDAYEWAGERSNSLPAARQL